MEQEKLVETINQTIKLDPHKKYIIKCGSIKEHNYNNYVAQLITFRDKLVELGIKDFIIMPNDADISIVESLHIDVGDIVYVVNPDYRNFPSRNDPPVLKCKVYSKRETLKKNGNIDSRICVEEINPKGYLTYNTSFKMKNLNKTFFRTEKEALEAVNRLR